MKSTGTKPESSTESDSKDSSRIGNAVRDIRGLLSDLKDWVDLRVKLLQVEIEEGIEEAAAKIVSFLVVVVLVLFTALFILIAIAEALGTWLGNSAYGYLIVGLVLALITIIINANRPPLKLPSQMGVTFPESDDQPMTLLPENRVPEKSSPASKE